MKGYFSQLARHTGLRFTNSARPTSPALRTQRPSPSSPLHVEEVTLVAPASTASNLFPKDAPASATALPEKVETTHTQIQQPVETSETASSPRAKGAETAQTDRSVPSTGFSPTFSTAVLSADVPIPSTETPGEAASAPIEFENVRHLSTEPQSASLERNIQRDQISAKPGEAETNQTKTESTPRIVNDLNPGDPVDREVLVRQYLREVRAWVAAPPTLVADVPENEIVQESHLTSEWQPESIATLTTERESPSAKQTTQRDHIDVHETSLSIGSISVIIEDPKPNVTTIAPIPNAPRAPQSQSQPEPISLSRYYLQRW